MACRNERFMENCQGIGTGSAFLRRRIIPDLQGKMKLSRALLQQIFIGNDNQWNFGRRGSKLHAQIRAYSCRLTSGNNQRRLKQKGNHWLLVGIQTVFNKRPVTQLTQPILEQLVRFERADRNACLFTLLLLADICIAPCQHLD